MNLACPSCGAAVSFRFDDSLVRVCPQCQTAVARTDRGAESLGKFADLAHGKSQLKLFSDGWWGEQSFILVGMAQLQHESGAVWQEWYAKLGGGVWGWLTEAQGKLYLTFERDELVPPAWEQLQPGAAWTIDGRSFFVNERTEAKYTSAMGEIPYRLVPHSQLFMIDLSDGRGGFATIDYGDGSQGPTVYVGQQITVDQLRISGGEDAPAARLAQGTALACPNCGGSLELHATASLAMACPYCANLIDISSGTLAIIGKQSRRRAGDIPLGAVGEFPEGKLTVIGYVARSALIDRSWFPFEEYLLHSPAVGYRWLLNSDHHWSYVQPIAGGAVEMTGGLPKYDGVRFEPFQKTTLRVDYVVGEFYWRVEIGETVKSRDYIAPPAMLSNQRDGREEHWSLSSYMTPDEVKKAFATNFDLAPPIGVAPNQPYPGGIGKVIGFFTFALFVAGVVRCSTSSDVVVHTERIRIPVGTPLPQPTAPTPPADPTAPPSSPPKTTGQPADVTGHITFSKSFTLDEHNIEIHTTASLANNWAYLAIDLVNEQTGELVSFDKNLEYYSGVEGGESWSEGSYTDSEVLGPLGPGSYMMRIDAQQGGKFPTDAIIEVHQNVFRSRWWLLAFGILSIPYGIVLVHAHSFRKRRMENANV